MDLYPKMGARNRIRNSRHFAFSDSASLSKLGNLNISDHAKEAIGALDGKYSFTIVLKFAEAFMRNAFEKKGFILLNKPSGVYSELRLTRSQSA
jgi:hypothetical protein